MVAADVLDEFEWTGANRSRRIERSGIDVLTVTQNVCWDDGRHPTGPEELEGGERLLQGHDDGVIVGCLDGLDLVVAGARAHRHVRVHDRLPRELHVAGGEWLAVMPLGVVAQGERP